MGGGEPIIDGGVIVDERGTVIEVGTCDALSGSFDARHDYQVILPGVLNCHVHLTDARRAEPLPGGAGLNRWVRELITVRNAEKKIDEEENLIAAVADTLDRMRDAGTVAVGEVANNLLTLDPIARSAIRCRFIHELIGFRRERAHEIMRRAIEDRDSVDWPENAHHTFGAHAPYSVAPELFRMIVEHTEEKGLFFHQHLAEDPDERLLYEQGDGVWREYLCEIGAWDETWRPQGAHPVEFYDRLGVLNDRFIAVHLADATVEEVELLARRGVRAILSPSSNLHITGKLPKLDAITASGMRFAFGTDGRGSNASIDVFSEAQILLERWSDLRPGIFLEGLTTSGAEILQFDDLGAIRPGARPGLLALHVEHAGDDLRSLERQIVMSSPEQRRLLT